MYNHFKAKFDERVNSFGLPRYYPLVLYIDIIHWYHPAPHRQACSSQILYLSNSLNQNSNKYWDGNAIQNHNLNQCKVNYQKSTVLASPGIYDPLNLFMVWPGIYDLIYPITSQNHLRPILHVAGCQKSWPNCPPQMRRCKNSARSRSCWCWCWCWCCISKWSDSANTPPSMSLMVLLIVITQIVSLTNNVWNFQATDNDALLPGENKLWGRGVVRAFI